MRTHASPSAQGFALPFFRLCFVLVVFITWEGSSSLVLQRHPILASFRSPTSSSVQMWQKNLRLRGGDDSTADNQGDVFAPISANDNERLEVDSLCMECRATGSTSILPTIIPNFGRIVVMAFRCPSCNHSSSEVQSADEIKPFGLHCILNVEGPEDMNRQVRLYWHDSIWC